MKGTIICDLLGIKYPIIQAPMTWITSAELVAAVSEAGGLGTLGPNAGAVTPPSSVVEACARLREQIRKVMSLTGKPFAVNLAIRAFDLPGSSKNYSDEFLRVILDEKVPVVVTVGPSADLYTKPLKQAGIKVLHRALPVNVEAARRAENAGVDILIAVGVDGGGHSGLDAIPTLSLLPQIVDAVKIPVVAGGGIVDGRGAVAALALGAAGIFMGTRFIACSESPAHPKAKQVLMDSIDDQTVTVITASGVLRSHRNPFMEHCLSLAAKGATPMEMYLVERGAIKTGLLDGDVVNGNLTWGASAGIIKSVKTARDIVHDILKEADEVLKKLHTA